MAPSSSYSGREQCPKLRHSAARIYTRAEGKKSVRSIAGFPPDARQDYIYTRDHFSGFNAQLLCCSQLPRVEGISP